MKTDKFYGQQAKRYKRVFNPGERKKELEAALLSDSGGSHKVKTIEYLSAILKEYDEAEKYLATRPQAPAPAQPAQAQGLRKNPPVRKMKAQAQMTDAEKEYYRKTEIGFAAVGKYVNTAFGVKNLFKNAKGHRRFAKKARDILRKNGVDPVGLFQKFGKANYVSFGQGAAIAKTAKIFGMNQKSKAWRGKNYQAILQLISQGTPAGSPEASPEPPRKPEPLKQEYSEDRPMPIMFTQNTNPVVRKELEQFFGTPVCMKAVEPVHREFLQREIYGILARELFRGGASVEDAKMTRIHDILKKFMPGFGIVPERAPGGRFTAVYQWYDKIFKWNKDTRPIWNDVIAKKTEHEMLTESTYDKLFKERGHVAPRVTKVRFEEPAVRKKRKKKPAEPILIKKMTFNRLVYILADEAKTTTSRNYKTSSIGFVEANLRYDPTLNAIMSKLDHTKDLVEKKAVWDSLWNKYRILMGPLGSPYEKPGQRIDDKVGVEAGKVLRNIHKRLAKVMAEELEPPDKGTKIRWREIYAEDYGAKPKPLLVAKKPKSQPKEMTIDEFMALSASDMAKIRAHEDAGLARERYLSEQAGVGESLAQVAARLARKPQPPAQAKPRYTSPRLEIARARKPEPPPAQVANIVLQELLYPRPPSTSAIVLQQTKTPKHKYAPPKEPDMAAFFAEEIAEDDISGYGLPEAEGALETITADSIIYWHAGVAQVSMDAIKIKYERSIKILRQVVPDIADRVEKLWKMTPKEISERETEGKITQKSRAKLKSLKELQKQLKARSQPKPKPSVEGLGRLKVSGAVESRALTPLPDDDSPATTPSASPRPSSQPQTIEATLPVLQMVIASPGLQQIVNDTQTDQDITIGTPVQIPASSQPVELGMDDISSVATPLPDQNVSLQAAMSAHGPVHPHVIIDPGISDPAMIGTPAPDDEKYSDDPTGEHTPDQPTPDTTYLQSTGLRDQFLGMRHDYGEAPADLFFRDDASMSAYSVRSGYTRASDWSMRARYRQPIGRATIVRLKDIKRRMGEKVELFSDASMLGFDRKHWESKLFKKYPLDFSIGFKKNLGPWITTNHNKNGKSLSFIVKNKVSQFQLNSLIGFIEGKCPPFHYLTIFRKGTVFEEVYNIMGLFDFSSYMKNELISVPSIHMKITW